MKRYAIVVAFSTLLGACSSGPQLTRIADLQPQPVQSIAPAVEFDIDRQKVIDSYRDLIALDENNSSDGREKQRLADLELEASIDKRIAEDNRTAEQGEQETLIAVERYLNYLQLYPDRADNDRILYQLSRAYAIDGQIEKSMQAMDRLVRLYPDSPYLDEVQFRRGESFFVAGRYAEAERAYQVIVDDYPESILFEKALYKSGWSRFKQNRLQQANDSFVALLQFYYGQEKLEQDRLATDLNRADQELIEDVLRVISLSFSYSPHRQPLATYFNKQGKRAFEPLLFQRLADLYVSKQRTTDAAEILIAFGEQYPYSALTPGFHNQAIDLYQKAGFSDLVLSEKQNFIKLYNVGTPYWTQQDENTQQALQPVITGHLFDTATHYHAVARSSKKSRDYRVAADWYRLYLKSFPNDQRAAEINFLLAESANDAGLLPEAIREYEKTAYQYPSHKNSAEAGYAALVTYRQLYTQVKKAEDKNRISEQLIQSSLRFGTSFPNDPRANDVLITTTEQYFAQQRFAEASDLAKRLIDNPQVKPPIKQRAWIVAAHSHFELKNYDRAETAYVNALAGLKPSDRKPRNEMREQLAASIYLQGDLARKAGQNEQAALHFERLGRVVPTSDKRIVAQYDAATEYLKLKRWPKAISVLEDFRRKYPKQKKWQRGVSEKLALAYSQNKQAGKAANELMMQVKLAPKNDQRDLLWQAAELYQQDGQSSKAIDIYKSYVRKYPRPVARSIELQHRIAASYLASKQTKKRQYWLKEIIKTDAKAGKERSDRSRYLAATASLELAQPVHQSFNKTRLTIPLKKSLKRKKKLMTDSINAYTKAAKYQVEEVTTSATFNIAEIYRQFARALLDSEKPKNLDEDELEEYTYLLEDQAYPFEEKAIGIHESNIARIAKGSYDDSIRNSLKSLAALMPFRYAKDEVSDIHAN